MQKIPHYYTLREHWNDADFVSAVQYIRDHGYQAKFGKTTYTYLNVNNYKYWTMGAPLDQTILINRAAIQPFAPYDDIAYKYDTIFNDAPSLIENQQLLHILAKHADGINDKSVLDIGCGTGIFLNYANPRKYLGIDPSAGMLSLMQHKHPDAATIQTTLGEFVPTVKNNKFDLIIALFGTASYLTDEELQRIQRLLTPNGKKFLMFYDENYFPITYQATRTNINRRPYNPNTIQGEARKFNAFTIVT